jgi:WD40 repeat protein
VSDAQDLVPVARPVPLDSFAAGSPARVLVDAFIAARLLVAAGEGGTATVRLAHEALIGRWERARNQLAADRRDLATRKLVEQQLRRYNEATRGRARRRLLLRNPDLASAADLERRWADELDAATRDFINRSKRRARVAFMLTAATAGLFGILAVIAGVAAWRAMVAENLAQSRADEALIAQSRSLAAQVSQRITASDPQGALALALEALPTSMARPDRPYTPEAEWMARAAYRFALWNDLERIWTTQAADEIDAASLSPDAQTVALAAGGVVRVINRATGSTYVLPGTDDEVWAMRFLPRPNQLLVASKSTLRIFDLVEKKDVMRVAAPPDRHICGWSFLPGAPPERPAEAFIGDGAETPEGVKLAMFSQGTEISLDGGTCPPTNSPLGSILKQMGDINPNASHLTFVGTPARSATVIISNASELWIQAQGGISRKVTASQDDKFIVGVPTSDAAQVVAALAGGRIAVVDMSTLIRLTQTPATGKEIASIDVNPNTQYMLIGYRDNTAEIWARRSHDELQALGPGSLLADANPSTCQSPETDRDIGTRDGALRLRIAADAASLVKVAEGAESVVARLGEPNARIRDAVFSDDERRIMVVAEPGNGPAEKVILTYDAGSGKLLDRKSREAGPGNLCVRVSPDGARLAVVNASELRIVDTLSGSLVRQFNLPTDRPYRLVGVAFNRAGDRLAALDSDGTLYISDAGSGVILDQYGSPFIAGGDAVPLAFDASGNRLLFVRNNEAYAWSFIAPLQDFLDAARAYVPWCIAPARRHDFYLPDEPPAWCIELGKKPYDSPAWKRWLAEKKAGRMTPMPTATD